MSREFHFEATPAFVQPEPARPPRTYQWLNHRITVANGHADCLSCSVPASIARLVETMAQHNIETLTVDSDLICRVHDEKTLSTLGACRASLDACRTALKGLLEYETARGFVHPALTQARATYASLLTS